jgi:hypothetical protein
MRLLFRSFVVALLAAVVVAVQARTGTIAGVVEDTDGGAVPGASVTVTGGDVQRKTLTDGQGRFEFRDLPPGSYRLVVRLAGFLSAAESLLVEGGRTSECAVKLEIGVSWRPLSAETPDPTDPALARGLYVAALDLIFRREHPGRLLVQAETVPLPHVINEDWTRQLEGAPAELRAQLAPGTARRSVWHNLAAFPPQSQLLPQAEITKAIGLFGAGDIARLRNRFGTSSYQAFSQVLVTADGLHALVQYGHHCGNLCGEGSLVWFSRSDRASSWMFRGRGFAWVS